MRIRGLVLVALLPACGTDTFGSDAGADAGFDGSDASDAVVDAIASESGFSCGFDGATPLCGGASNCAAAEVCCLMTSGVHCRAVTNCVGGEPLGCRNATDCALDDGGLTVCCLINASITAACPSTISGGSSQCVVAGGCNGSIRARSGRSAPNRLDASQTFPRTFPRMAKRVRYDRHDCDLRAALRRCVDCSIPPLCPSRLLKNRRLGIDMEIAA